MSEIHSFNNMFQISRPLTLDFGDPKLRDLAKLCFFNWLWRNWTLKIAVMTSFQWRHRYASSKRVSTLTSQIFPFCLPIKISGYACLYSWHYSSSSNSSSKITLWQTNMQYWTWREHWNSFFTLA